jgi:hypothetical protein
LNEEIPTGTVPLTAPVATLIESQDGAPEESANETGNPAVAGLAPSAVAEETYAAPAAIDAGPITTTDVGGDVTITVVAVLVVVPAKLLALTE